MTPEQEAAWGAYLIARERATALDVPDEDATDSTHLRPLGPLAVDDPAWHRTQVDRPTDAP